MELRQLRYFEAVVRHRHFTRAADELNIAQSAVSHQVGRLEAELGTALLHRTTRSVHPTAAGELVAARARAVLDSTDGIAAEVDELGQRIRGRITVGTVLYGGAVDIPALLADFTVRFPQVEVSLRDGTAREMADGLRAGEIDVTFALEPAAAPPFAWLALSAEELTLVLAPGHRLGAPHPGEPLPLTELDGEPLIAFARGASIRATVDAALSTAGAVPRITFEGSNLALVRALVAQGLGVAIVPRTFAEMPGPAVALRPITPALTMTVALWWRADRPLVPAARAFVDFAADRGIGGANDRSGP